MTTLSMHRILLSTAVALAWLVIVWGCVVTAFGGADLYTVVSGGVQPGEATWGGEPAPTVGQAAGEVAVGLVMITVALLCHHLLGKKKARLKGATGQLTQS